METLKTKASHTPGPWGLIFTEKGELELGGGIEQYTGVKSETGFGEVAHVIFKKTNILGDSKVLERKTFEANARLIAAAPELLKCLLMIQEGLNDGIPVEKNDPFHKVINDVIKKAKGL
jgi:hypothetical protein